nr:unnamed protein product [Spirometra erinaceieuropaei]
MTTEPCEEKDLTITLSSERPDTEVDLVPDNKDLCAINIQTFVDQQEWHLHEHIEISKRSVVQEFSNSSQSHSCLSVTCRAARRPGYFYWNVFLIMFFITGLSFPTFAVSAERPENRLQLSFTLFLTSVAFKFVINQSLPKISYLTFMDKYVLMSLGVLCVVSVWHAAVTLVPAYSLPDQSLKNPTNTGLLMDEWNYLPLFQSCLPQGWNFQEWLGLLESLQLFNSSKPKLPFTGSPNLLIPRRAIPKWMDDSLTDALRFKPTSTNETNEGRELTILQRAIHLALQRRLLERQKQVDLIRAEMKELEDQRTNLLNRVERGVFIAFCIFYFVAHIVFICWVYFGAGKRRREMIERDKQYRTWMRKRLDWTESNPVSRPPIPVNKTA